MVDISININKMNNNLLPQTINDGQQFHKYQQDEQ